MEMLCRSLNNMDYFGTQEDYKDITFLTLKKL